MKVIQKIGVYIAGIFLVIVVLSAVFAGIIAPFEPERIDLYALNSPPDSIHFLGTDELGRDVLSRLIYGGRVSLIVGIFAAFIQVVIGTCIGTLAGYFGGKVDRILMKVTELFMCFPFFVIAITMAALFGPGLKNIILILGILSWPGLARIVRAEVIKIKQETYVEAAKALGLSKKQIMVKHILPGIWSQIKIYGTNSIAGSMLSEASLSFLGMGIRPPMASWGNMLSTAQNINVIQFEWWNWLPSSLLIMISVMSIYSMGDLMGQASKKPSLL